MYNLKHPLIFWIFLPLAIAPFQSIAQDPGLDASVDGNLVDDGELGEEVRNYEVYSISIKKAKYKKKPNKDHIKIKFELDSTWSIKMYESHILPELAIEELENENISPALTLYGEEEEDDVRARITINEDFIYGYIESGSIIRYIEPANYIDEDLPENYYAVYTSIDSGLVASSEAIGGLPCGSSFTQPKATQQNLKSTIKSFSSTTTNVCRTMNIAIASDHTMFDRYGSIQGVHNHNMGVINNIQGDYDGVGDDPFMIDLHVIAEYTSMSISQNPYNTTTDDAALMLPEFSSWALSNGFGPSVTPGLQSNVSNTIAQLWTAKQMTYQDQGNVVGLAFTPGNFCILEDYLGPQENGSAWQLRMLTSHEMGHNFNAPHDGTSCDAVGNGIMWPCLKSNSTFWNASAIQAIQNNLDSRTLSGCDGVSCTNGTQDVGEIGIDCGGTCPTDCCSNGVKDSNEMMIDCGGPDCAMHL